MNSISTIIVVKDNPPHLSATLDSIYSFSSEILIADIGMAPNLKKQLLTNSKIKIVQINESVTYVELIREKIKSLAKYEYILFLDPDEVLSRQLINILNSSMGIYDYVKIPRKNIIFSKWIEHSRWWPDYQVRFFKKDSVVWPTEIHKQPTSTGKELVLEPKEENAIIHYNYESIDEYLTKAMRYAKSESQNPNKQNKLITLNSTIKIAISEFISRFFSDQGYRDGIRGFILAFFQMIYPFLVYFYYLESIKYTQISDEKDLIQSSVSFSKQLFSESLYWKGKKKSISLKERVISKLIKTE